MLKVELTRLNGRESFLFHCKQSRGNNSEISCLLLKQILRGNEFGGRRKKYEQGL